MLWYVICIYLEKYPLSINILLSLGLYTRISILV